MIDDSGFGNRNNNGIVYLESHNARLFAGTWNPVDGCLVYASSDGTDWTPVTTPGFGDKDNQSIVKLRSANGYLYAGTWNLVTGGQLWRAADPHTISDWERITGDGFGNPTNQAVGSIRLFGDRLFVGMFNPTQGEEMWVSEDGAAGSFVCSFSGGLGLEGATDASYLYEWEGDLYLGTESAQPPYPGCLILRTRGSSVLGKEKWTQVAPPGFSEGTSFNAFRMVAFHDRLYVGTWEFGASSYTSALGRNGTRIWRTSGPVDGGNLDWEQVNCDGFGRSGHDATLAMEVWLDRVYVGGFGEHGFLFSSPDGMTWEAVTAEGFLTTTEFGVHALAVFRGDLYIGIQNWFQPSALWRIEGESPGED